MGLLYVEGHYAPLGLSLLKRREPEVLADLPFRTEPGTPVPVVCIIKDAHLYPVRIKLVSVGVVYPSGRVREHEFGLEEFVAEPLWHKVFHFLPEESGRLTVEVTILCSRRGREFVVRNDNLRTASHAPFRVLASPCPLPRAEGWHYGDAHFHSSYTWDQAEFGAPLGAAAEVARAMGLSWFAVTDHSYDLDDREDSYLENDPELPRWRRLLEEAEEVDFPVLVGEEVSCGSSEGKNIHLLAFGIRELVEGKGDSGERWLRTEPDLGLQDALEEVLSQGGVAYAAHPFFRFTLAQRMFLGRGSWTHDDLRREGLSGLQFWNGVRGKEFEEGRTAWIELLSEGRKLYALGGNDAHGDFNRFRCLWVPLLKVRELPFHIFGRVRTAAYCPDGPSPEAVLGALREGRTVVTDGPMVLLRAEGGRWEVEAASSGEFGRLKDVRVIFGEVRRKAERTLWRGGGDTKVGARGSIPGRGYLRAEAETETGALGLTNPVWT